MRLVTENKQSVIWGLRSMKLKEFKQQLKQLNVVTNVQWVEDKLLTDYGLTEEKIEISYFDWAALENTELDNLQQEITELNIKTNTITIF